MPCSNASTQNPVLIIRCLQPSAHTPVPKTAGNLITVVAIAITIDTMYGIRIASTAENWNFIVIIFMPDTV